MGKSLKICCGLLFFLMNAAPIFAQQKTYTLDDCISYALKNNTDIGRVNNEVTSQQSWLEQKKAAQLPNLALSGSNTWSSTNSYAESSGAWDRSSSSYMSLSLGTNVTLYNGAKLKNAILQGRTNLNAAKMDIQTQTELISLNILSAYINVMLTQEQMNNSKAQLEVTAKQLEQATVRKEAGVLSPSDFLNIKSQYATDKASFIAAQSNLRIFQVALMQMMNMPVDDDFNIATPEIESLLNTDIETTPSTVYNLALDIQPGVKTAELDLKSAQIDIDIAKADILPELSLSSSLGTYYASGTDNIHFGEQFSHQVSPSIGLSLSVPIFQRKVVKNSVTQAKISAENQKYNLIDIHNALRKSIEQACTDAETALSAFQSTNEQLTAQKESYRLAEEMFAQGMINAVDYLTSKNNLYTAENEHIQAKYNLVLQNKIIEYYMGNPIKL